MQTSIVQFFGLVSGNHDTHAKIMVGGLCLVGAS